jgi:hypothetical protein
MSQVSEALSAPKKPISVNVYAVCKPGTDPDDVHVVPNLIKLGFQFGKMEPGEIVEAIALASAYSKALDKWTEAAKEALKPKLEAPAEVGQKTVTPGVTYEAHYSLEARVALDQEKIKNEMGPDWVAAHSKRTEYYKLMFKPIVQTPAASA